MTIRTCTVDGGSKTNDVELIRTGNNFKIENENKNSNFSLNLGNKFSLHQSYSRIVYKYNDTTSLSVWGYISICDTSDGCNDGQSLTKTNKILYRIMTIALLFFWKINISTF